MTIHFYLRFHSNFGQRIFVSGNTDQLGNNNPVTDFPLTWLNDEFWYGSVDLPDHQTAKITYTYILREDNGNETRDGDGYRKIEEIAAKEIMLIDTWNQPSDVNNAFSKKPFREILKKPSAKQPKYKEPKSYTHEFRVKAPLLTEDEWVCMTGSGNYFKEWDEKNPLPLILKDEWYIVKANLAKEKFPVSYKYGIFNTKNKTFVYEDGDNRILNNPVHEKSPNLSTPFGGQGATILHDGFVRHSKRWKGSGIAIPVFSLRSKNGFGVGEFADIKLLADWAQQCGIKVLQFLPINDTISSSTRSDSYPYAAISAFALHPLYINLEKVKGDPLTTSLEKIKKQLNALPVLDYETVIEVKLSTLRKLYKADKQILNESGYIDFFEKNKHWLQPYASFCFLRDKNKTADPNKWKAGKVYSQSVVQKLTETSDDEISFYYFVQYHLHLQLKEAVDYTHSKGIILKGDIPIGISKNSSDAWTNPAQYNLGEQAGAPPDDFAIKGQNWGFPTYNWQMMQKDNYSWWQRRLQQMNNYFDAFRIDHILGFFRIWSIPRDAVEGILGRFVPAIPLTKNEFERRKIWFDHKRYCDPLITEDIIATSFNGESEGIKKEFLENSGNGFYRLKEKFNTQKKIDDHFKKKKKDGIKTKFFDLLSNVILLQDTSPNSGGDQYHFRISMQHTSSFQALDSYTREQLFNLYNNYFFKMQDELWKKEALQKLPVLKNSTDMLICGEDLGMVPYCLPDVMRQMGMLSLEVQRMPKDPDKEFFHPRDAPYMSVVTPSTHDMSTIREWWEEEREKTQKFYNRELGHYGLAPYYCEPWINKEIIIQHLYSPAMLSIFQLQDLLGMDEKLRRKDPRDERINQPADPDHYWNFRIHIPLEKLMKQKKFTRELAKHIKDSGRNEN